MTVLELENGSREWVQFNKKDENDAGSSKKRKAES